MIEYFADETVRSIVAAAAFDDEVSLSAIAAEIAASPQDAIAEVLRQLANVAATGVRATAVALDRPLDEHLARCHANAAAVFL